MATAVRPVHFSRVDSLQEAPEGPIPAPFPTVLIRDIPEPDRITSALVSLPGGAISKPADLPESVDSVAQALTSVAECQQSVILALSSVLEPYLLIPSLQAKVADSWSPPNSVSSLIRRSYHPNPSLQVILTYLSDTSDSPVQMQSLSSSTSLLSSKISDTLSAKAISYSMRSRDYNIGQALLSVIATSAELLDESSARNNVRVSQPDLSPTSQLDSVQQALTNLLQSTAFDVLQSRPSGSENPIIVVQQALAATHLRDSILRFLDTLLLEPQGQAPPAEVLSTLPPRPSHDSELPPEYQYQLQDLPPYDTLSSASTDEFSVSSKVRYVQSEPDLSRIHDRPLDSCSSPLTRDEKKYLDFHDMALAVERLYTVAPQLNNQRVELKPSKRQELELAKIVGNVHRVGDRIDGQRARVPLFQTQLLAPVLSDGGKGKEREREAEDPQDMDDFLDLILRVQRTQMVEQRVVVPDGLRKIENAKAREAALATTREAFVDEIKKRVETGRLHDQDATFTRDKLMTLPEFIRESSGSRPSTTSSATSVQLTEAASEDTSTTTPPLSRRPSESSFGGLMLKTKRSFTRPRSASAPLLDASAVKKIKTDKPEHLSDVQYTVEYQRNLRLVSALVTLPRNFVSTRPQMWYTDIFGNSAKSVVLALPPDSKSAPPTTLKIILPVPVSTSTQAPTPRVASDRIEFKMTSAPNLESDAISSYDEPSLLDAAQLNRLQSTSFICSSCSLPLLQCRVSRMDNKYDGSPPVFSYSDLPSEYWDELVEAWMCHSDQKLSKEVIQKGKGSSSQEGWTPSSPTQVLVGGSYILVSEAVVITSSISTNDANNMKKNGCRQLRCICGAVLGTRQSKANQLNSTFRFAKYAIRPTGGSVELERPPLSAFIVADMLEIVQAHACHRFIIHDEEDEKVRILIWMFNPSVWLSYSLTKAYSLPKKGTYLAAKVMFKLIGPSETIRVEQLPAVHPGFANAEHLYYPLAICHSLAVLLLESNRGYPESSQRMGNLKLGWLRRA